MAKDEAQGPFAASTPTGNSGILNQEGTGSEQGPGEGTDVGLLEQSTCSFNDLSKYLSTISRNYADAYVKTGKWPSGIQIPKSPDVLNFDGSINWDKAPKGGYVLDGNGNAVRTEYFPQVGDIVDRYGFAEGRYTSPMIDGKSVDYDLRALPFIEDKSQYHSYQVIGDISKLQDYVENCQDADLRSMIEGAIDYYYNGNYSEVIPYRGYIAGIEGWGSGGGLQEEFPIKIAWLEKLGILMEIF